MADRIRRQVLMTTAGLLAGLSGRAWGIGNRRLIVAYGVPGSDALLRLEQLVDERRCELSDRDVDVYVVDAAEIARLTGESSAESSPAALARYRGEGDFELVLVGKDGGVKGRAAEPEAIDDFLREIDGMPMRQAEMSRRDDTSCPD